MIEGFFAILASTNRTASFSPSATGKVIIRDFFYLTYYLTAKIQAPGILSAST